MYSSPSPTSAAQSPRPAARPGCGRAAAERRGARRRTPPPCTPPAGRAPRSLAGPQSPAGPLRGAGRRGGGGGGGGGGGIWRGRWRAEPADGRLPGVDGPSSSRLTSVFQTIEAGGLGLPHPSATGAQPRRAPGKPLAVPWPHTKGVEALAKRWEERLNDGSRSLKVGVRSGLC